MRSQGIILLLCLAGLAGAAGFAPAGSLLDSTPAPPTPSPMPGSPVPHISGTWSVTRSWFRRCPRCSEPVIQGTTWEIFQDGPALRIDRGLRGTIEGNLITLEGIESDGFHRFDFIYGRLVLSPDGLFITGSFAGTERVQNTCGYQPPMVTCFASAGYLYAVRLSPLPTLPPPPPVPSAVPPATVTPSATMSATPPLEPVPVTPSATQSFGTPTATSVLATPAAKQAPLFLIHLPLVYYLPPPTE